MPPHTLAACLREGEVLLNSPASIPAPIQQQSGVLAWGVWGGTDMGHKGGHAVPHGNSEHRKGDEEEGVKRRRYSPGPGVGAGDGGSGAAAQVGPRGVGARGLSVTRCCAVRARHEVSVQLCGCAVSSALRGSVKRGECDVAPLEACSADGVRGSVTWSMPWGCVQWSGCSAVQCSAEGGCAVLLSCL